MTLRVRRPGSAISPAGEIKPPPFDSPTRAKPIRMGSSGRARPNGFIRADSLLGGNRSLSWIFYLWFAKLTIIKYLTRSTPTRALGLSSGFARPRFDSPRAGKQNRPVYSHWAHLFVVRSGGRSGIIFSPSLENFHDPGSAISPAGEIKPPPFDSPTRAKQFARSSGHDKNTL